MKGEAQGDMGDMPPARLSRRLAPIAALGVAVALTASCNEFDKIPKQVRPLDSKATQQLQQKGMTTKDSILLRIFKEESELEVWKRRGDTGRFALFKTYDVCKWSGELGPKIKEGDRQAPEGFYAVAPAQMNPRSSYHLAFNMGFPNAFDRAHERTGSHLMVHGACSSRGCYSMEDEQIQEIYTLARLAFRGGQQSFQIHAFPFRMTPENMARHRDSPHYEFWKMLKEGSDHFEVSLQEPKIDVCSRRYVFNTVVTDGLTYNPTGECPAEMNVPPAIEQAVASKIAKDTAEELVIAAKLEAEAEAERQKLLAAAEKERQKQLAEVEKERRRQLAAAEKERAAAQRERQRQLARQEREREREGSGDTAVAAAAPVDETATGSLPRPRPGSESEAEALGYSALPSRTADAAGGFVKRWWGKLF